MSEEFVMRAEGVGKRYCRNLRRSLWYGVQDSIGDLLARDHEADTLRKDEFWAVDDVAFELKRGECIGLIGHNGAGKTTLLKMLSGLIKPDRGRIEINGRLGALIALGAGFNPILSGRENVYINGAVLGLSKREIDAKYDEILAFADIGEFIEAPVQSYSSGMQVRLGFAIAIAVQPDILLLDEVLAVGDAGFQAKCLNALAKFREGGTSFFLVAHNAHMISRYCQRVLYMRHGRPVFLGDVETGLGMLAEEMAGTGVQSDTEIDWSAVRGSGRVRLTGGRFVDQDENVVERIAVGQELSLLLDYERVDVSVDEIRIDVGVRDRDDLVFQSDNIHAGQSIRLNYPVGNIRIGLGPIPWNSDSLLFSFALLDPRTAEVFDWKRYLTIALDRQALSQGSIFLKTQWSVENSNQTALNPAQVYTASAK